MPILLLVLSQRLITGQNLPLVNNFFSYLNVAYWPITSIDNPTNFAPNKQFPHQRSN